MSTMPEPQPGRYLDSCGTLYEATRHPKNGWHLRKNPAATEKETAYPKPDFPAAVNAGIFTYQS
jgi:hypothetical protein